MTLLARVRCALGDLGGHLLARFTKDRSCFTISDNGSPYLSRYHLIRGPKMTDGSSPYDRHGNQKRQAQDSTSLIGLYIHHFHRGDSDQECHSHPWAWSLSFIVSGGYREERRMGSTVVSRILPPLSFNWIGQDDFHRVDLLGPDAWTIFLAGPRVASWSFWSRHTGNVTPWRMFLDQKQRSLS